MAIFMTEVPPLVTKDAGYLTNFITRDTLVFLYDSDGKTMIRSTTAEIKAAVNLIDAQEARGIIERTERRTLLSQCKEPRFTVKQSGDRWLAMVAMNEAAEKLINGKKLALRPI